MTTRRMQLQSKRGAIARRAVERGARTEFLAFRMAEEIYAVPISYVKEILKPPPLTEVPRAPPDVMGVISVRGRIVTVRDLRKRMRLSQPQPTRKSRILLAELSLEQGGNGERVGLFVDEVLHVYRLSEAEIESAASVLGSDLAEYVAGIGRQGGEMIILIDLRSILSPAKVTAPARPVPPTALTSRASRTQ
ncbi:MAG: chemotaxis protein CheW [Polyangiales bacterium]